MQILPKEDKNGHRVHKSRKMALWVKCLYKLEDLNPPKMQQYLPGVPAQRDGAGKASGLAA